MDVRKETFYRNRALLEKKFGDKHREAFGPNAKLSYYGYPDMGSNLYSDILSYKDWHAINNAQRMHDKGYEHAVVLFPNAFICAMSFPGFTAGMLAFYSIFRINHINSYTSIRGHNKAFALEETLKLCLIILIAGAMCSSVRLTGILAPYRGLLRSKLTRRNK